MRWRGLRVVASVAAVCAAVIPSGSARAGGGGVIIDFPFDEVVYSLYSTSGWTPFMKIVDDDESVVIDPSGVSGVLLGFPNLALLDPVEPASEPSPPACYSISTPEGSLMQFAMDLDIRGCVPDATDGSVGGASDEPTYIPLAGFVWIPVTEGEFEFFSCLDVAGLVTTLGDFEGVIEFAGLEVDVGSTNMSADVESLVSSLGSLVSSLSSFPLETTSRDRLYNTPGAQFGFGLSFEDNAEPPASLGDGDLIWTLGLTFQECRSSGFDLDLDIDHYLNRAAQAEQSALPDTR